MTPRILIVDDERSIVKVIRKQLEIAGYEVAVSLDGEDGLAKAQAWRPDVIILDVMLPRVNGYEVCATLKADQDLRQIPILMLTARAQPPDREQGLRSGADIFLTKPFDLEDLLRQVQALLNGS